MTDEVFLIPARPTATAGLLAGAAARRGMAVRALGPGFAALAGRAVHWCGGPHAGARVAGVLGLGLLEPPDDWLARLPERFTGRRIELTTLGRARALTGSGRAAFVKPPREKSFPPAVYGDGAPLPRSLPAATPVLVSEVVDFAAEYRLFLIDGEIAAASRYAVHGRLDPAPLDADPRGADVRGFAAGLLAETAPSLPSAVTVDVGLVGGTGRFAVVEANMPWFSNSYAARPDAVLDVVLRAAGPRDRVRAADLPFVTS
ncbi:ATP-grasp domain-containing protein [Streptomyces sp. NBC_01294]|uniref:ATP-grasp domain-containing protein n=1 Tax=Streptomyces sp. NBC_01294 TaxID=2903815 RepID=UPI002DDABB6C|nr:ATP-grasp domain-containing protein [Streptomyces sp. NBC_01294]WRZ58429.1 ATP-grasp domain-containing protein [Streptomyces sp. NBC_01294]